MRTGIFAMVAGSVTVDPSVLIDEPLPARNNSTALVSRFLLRVVTSPLSSSLQAWESFSWIVRTILRSGLTLFI